MQVEKSDGVTTVEVFFADLSEDAQRAILNAYGIDTPDEMNWDILPLFTLEISQEE